jgi:hypothetical protein
MNCTFCDENILDKNTATFECGHRFHLSCLLSNCHTSLCSTCHISESNLPDTGLDRNISISASALIKIKERQLKPSVYPTLLQKISRALTPLTPVVTNIADHMAHNKRLSTIAHLGFEATDAVRERMTWSEISSRYTSADILEFGFKWKEMVSLGITPTQLQLFSWSQQIRALKLNADAMMEMKMTITELASLKYTTHQLIELGFHWNLLHQMGANVETWKSFGFTLSDIKRYWSPTLSQWVSAGFYDKARVEKAGWEMDDLLTTLPSARERSSGRVLRLEF